MPNIACKFCHRTYSSYIMQAHEESCSENPAAGELPAPPPPPVVYEVEQRSDEEITADLGSVEGEEPKLIQEGLFMPNLNPYFVIPVDLQEKLARTLLASKAHPKNVLFTGPQGSGKTSLGQQMAAKDSRFCFIAPCVTMQEPSQWFGYWTVANGQTMYVKSQFIHAIETPNCVVILDDMNRVENPKVLNPLFPILDDQRGVYLDDLGRYIKVAEGVIFVGTVNEGFAFQGTDPIDLALRDRFDQIAIDYPPGNQIMEILQKRTGVSYQTAEQLGRFARNLADHPNPEERIFISMRQMISIAEDVVLGGSIRDAVTFTISAGMPDEASEKVNAILQTILSDNYTARVPDWRPWA